MNHSIEKAFDGVRTENLFLRMPQPKDLADILSIEGDPATNRYRPAGPIKGPNEAKETLAGWRNNWLTDGYGYWAVVLPPQSEIIGIGGIRKEHWQGQDILNLYYRFSPKAWGRGYATELGRTAVKMACDYLPDLPVVARIRPSNKPSIRLAEKIGLRHFPELDSDEHMAFALRQSFTYHR